MLQSTRQGSFWGAHLFLFYVNPLIKLFREANLGARIGNIFCGAVFHADDIALLAVQKVTLQRMMDMCYKFNCEWRPNLHPKKMKIMVFGETRYYALTNSVTRIWKLGDKIIEEVKNHFHCGIKLTTDKTTVNITKDLCRKGRGIMLSLQHCGIGKLLPLTLVKLYKAIVLPSALFGCELWTNVSDTEYKMLEKMQRFCAKYIQNLGRSTRSDMCVPMLGLMSLFKHILIKPNLPS